MIIKNEIDKTEKAIRSLDPTVLDIVPLTLEEIFIYEMEANGYYAQEESEESEESKIK